MSTKIEHIMTVIKTFIQKHPLAFFFTLTFLLSWGCIVLIIGPSGFPITVEQFEAVGALVYMAMLIGPTGAGLLLIGLINGKAGFSELKSRLIRWRVSVFWYVAAILAAPLMATGSLLIISLFSPEFMPAILTSQDRVALLLSGIMAGLMVGIFEELGWTGFAVPCLRQRYGILQTGLIVGIVWGAWHFILFWESDTFSDAIPLMLLLARLFSWLPPFRILMVWVYERTQSLPVVMLLHMSLVVTTLAIPSPDMSRSDTLIWLITWAALLWIAAGVVLARKGKSKSPIELKFSHSKENI